jgi:hypothetical protein
MPSWSATLTAAPELAGLVQSRFDAHGLGLLATIRKDGAPRISGIEPSFSAGELWLGMMDGSLKARDLQRDPRFSLHNATTDKAVSDGDAKISGRAVEVTDQATFDAFAAAFSEATGYAPPGPFHLFRADVTEIVLIRPRGDHLLIESWSEPAGTRTIKRA